MSEWKRRHVLVLGALTVLIGLLGGIGGMGLALLLHLIQHLSYGYQLDPILGEESFLHGVSAADAPRRAIAMLLCGVIAGFGWLVLYRFGRPLLPIRQAVSAPEKPMPIGATVAHALLQIITVAMGSPLGREVAPREIGALAASLVARRAGLSDAECRIMIACGAGAGLAAVYNVPLGGALFTLEALLGSFALAAVLPAITTAVIAALVAWIGLGNRIQYQLPDLHISVALVVFAIVFGPLFGVAGYWYARIALWARARAPRDGRIVPWCIAAFAAVGVASIWYPALLGNGRAPMQLALSGAVPLALAVTLLVLKLCATTLCLRAGAEGGLLTPGLATGALLATLIGGACNLAGAHVAPGAYAIIGAVALLASSMSMPLTAVALVFEFTRVGQDFLIPILLAVAGSMAARGLCERA